MTTTRLETTWPRYYERGTKAATWSDTIRLAILHGETVGPAADASEGARLSSEVSTLTKLGYHVERVGVEDDEMTRTAYRITNLNHRPSPEDFARQRSRPATSSTSNGNGNGHAPALQQVASGMLPDLGDRLTASVVGFDEDGAPYLVLTGPDGWRYSCRVTESRAPRTSD